MPFVAEVSREGAPRKDDILELSHRINSSKYRGKWYFNSMHFYFVEWSLLNLTILGYLMFGVQSFILTISLIIITGVSILLRIYPRSDVIRRILVGRRFLYIVIIFIGYSLIFWIIILRLTSFFGVTLDIEQAVRPSLLFLSFYLSVVFFGRRIIMTRSQTIREIMTNYEIFQHLGLEEYFPYSYRSGSVQLNFSNMGLDELPDGWIRMVGYAEQINFSVNPISDLNISIDDVKWFKENRSEIWIIGLVTNIRIERELIRGYLPEIKIVTDDRENLNEVLNLLRSHSVFFSRGVMIDDYPILKSLVKWLLADCFVVYPQDKEQLELYKKHFHLPAGESMGEKHETSNNI